MCLGISDDSGVGAARRAAAAWTVALGFDETRKGSLALIVTEVANNVLYHGKDGEILLRQLREENDEGVEVLAIDRGPGMTSVTQCMVDGYSTLGTRGVGLGSIERAADEFDIFSVPNRGTVVLARLWKRRRTGNLEAGQRFGAVCVPLRGEHVCGDGFGITQTPERTRIALFDGLGHGQGAADATLVGLREFHLQPSLGPAALLAHMHEAMRPTRGAAAAIVEIEPGVQRLRFAGVGNCAGSIHDPRSDKRPQGLASHNGTVGAQLPRVNEFNHAWPADGLLVMHTDGLATRWNLDDYPGLAVRHPSLIAAVLYRDFSRHRDDVTVLAFATRSA